MKRLFNFFFSVSLMLALCHCGAPSLDISTTEGQKAIYDATNIALTHGECDLAVSFIEPLYSSKYSNNYARLLFASAQGCKAGIDYFPFLGKLTGVTISSGGIWTALTSIYPYSDYKGMNAGWLGMDALEASFVTSLSNVPAAYRFNTGTNNVGSYDVTDRTDESNSYLLVLAMSVIGRTQFRNGAPNAGFHKTQSLPWTTAAAMTQEGCEYAAAIVNMIDGIDAVASSMTGSVKTVMQSISTVYKAPLGTACENGCTNTALTGCTLVGGDCTATNSFCPLELRWGGGCTTSVTNKAGCAAAGIVHFINTNLILGWQ